MYLRHGRWRGSKTECILERSFAVVVFQLQIKPPAVSKRDVRHCPKGGRSAILSPVRDAVGAVAQLQQGAQEPEAACALPDLGETERGAVLVEAMVSQAHRSYIMDVTVAWD